MSLTNCPPFEVSGLASKFVPFLPKTQGPKWRCRRKVSKIVFVGCFKLSGGMLAAVVQNAASFAKCQSVKANTCVDSTGKAKRRHLNASECDELARSSNGPAALIRPHVVGSGRGSGDPSRGLYPRTPTKRPRRGRKLMLLNYIPFMVPSGEYYSLQSLS